MSASEYRRGVGIVLFDHRRRIWIGQRPGAGWHMPQGGIEPGEEPREAVMRELLEEVGTNKATIVAEHDDWLSYDVPEPMRPSSWQDQYVGQIQKWFCLRFDGTDADVNTQTDIPEFDAWRWATMNEVLAAAIEFKRELYPRVLAAFLRLL